MARTSSRAAASISRIAFTTAAALALGAMLVHAQSAPPITNPSTQPTTQQSTYDRLLGNAEADRIDKPIQPIGRNMVDQTTGQNAVAPGAPQLVTRREGSFLPRVVGRLTKAMDGSGWEFALEADGAALQDPPLKVLPNLKLMAMEDQITNLNRDLRFRVSGMVTEYRGRNYLLVEEVVVVREAP